MDKEEKLTRKQLHCIEVMMLNPGLSDSKISELAGCRPESICKWRKSELFSKTLQAELDKQWEDARALAQKKMLELCKCGNAPVEFNANKYVLDSLGLGATQKVDLNADVNTTVINVTVDEECEECKL